MWFSSKAPHIPHYYYCYYYKKISFYKNLLLKNLQTRLKGKQENCLWLIMTVALVQFALWNLNCADCPPANIRNGNVFLHAGPQWVWMFRVQVCLLESSREPKHHQLKPISIYLLHAALLISTHSSLPFSVKVIEAYKYGRGQKITRSSNIKRSHLRT